MSSEKKNLFWSAFQTISFRGASFIFSIIIARFVSPESYGLIAMITVFLAFFNLFVDGGLGNALIQKKDKNPEDYSTVYFSNLAMAIILYVAMFFVAPLIGKFYNQPELVLLIRIVSLSLIIQAFFIVQRSKLTILMDFKSQARIGIYAIIGSGILGLVLAYKGFEVWALIAQSLSNLILQALFFQIIGKWRPSLTFSFSSFKKLFSYSSKELISSIFTSFYIQINNLVIGKFYSPASLAFYNRGFNLGFLAPSLIEGSVTRVTFPLWSKLQDNRTELLRSYFKYLSFGSWLTLPLCAIIGGLAKPIILFLLTDRWGGAIPFLMIMAGVFCTYSFNNSMVQVVYATGHPGKNAKALFIKRGFSFLFLAITIPMGVQAIAWGVLISTLIEVFIASVVSARVLSIPIISQYKKIFPHFIIATSIFFICYLICKLPLSSFLQLLCGLPISLLVYVVLTILLRLDERFLIYNFMNKIKTKL